MFTTRLSPTFAVATLPGADQRSPVPLPLAGWHANGRRSSIERTAS